MSENSSVKTYTTSQFFTHTLPNGLQILGEKIPDVESTAVCFYVRTGARDEHDQSIAGVSHFLEHMVFKGTNNRSAEEISLEFNNVGAEFNAFTSLEQTVYYARILGEYYERTFDLLSDMMRPKLDAQEFDTERNVIIEEIARTEDVPSNVAFRKLLHNYFNIHPLGHDVLGSRESIRGMHVDQMRSYWQRRYAPNNMLLCVAGNFDWEKVIKLAEDRCGSWQQGESGRTSSEYEPDQPKVIVMEKETLLQEHLALAFPSVSMKDPLFYAAQLAGMILGDETGSRLFWNIHQKGLAETAVASFNPFDGTGMMAIYANTSPENAPAVLKLIKSEIESLEEDGVHHDELRRAKDKLISHTILDGESTYSRMREIGYTWVAEGRLRTIDEEVASIEAVTVDDVNKLLKEYPATSKLVLSALGPVKEGEMIKD